MVARPELAEVKFSYILKHYFAPISLQITIDLLCTLLEFVQNFEFLNKPRTKIRKKIASSINTARVGAQFLTGS